MRIWIALTRRMATPDLIIVNADIITMDPSRPRAQAVAVADGRISAVGSDNEITALVGEDTQVVDLNGGLLALDSSNPTVTCC